MTALPKLWVDLLNSLAARYPLELPAPPISSLLRLAR